MLIYYDYNQVIFYLLKTYRKLLFIFSELLFKIRINFCKYLKNTFLLLFKIINLIFTLNNN